MQKVRLFSNFVFSWIKEKPEPLTQKDFISFLYIFIQYSVKKIATDMSNQFQRNLFLCSLPASLHTNKFKAKITVKCQFSVLGKSANNPGYVDISSRKLTWKEGAFCSATDFCHIKKDSIECRRNNIQSLQFVSLF